MAARWVSPVGAGSIGAEEGYSWVGMTLDGLKSFPHLHKSLINYEKLHD
jgi:hypothetical protein